jgi:predicted phage terminase large subunit-like protein
VAAKAEAGLDARYLDAVALDQELAGRGLANFIRVAWPVLEPATPLVWGWHMAAVAEHVQALFRGEIRRLLVCVPPGTAKSLIAAVFGPAWQWGPGRRPAHRIICASYSGTLSRRDSVRCRHLIESPWYQARWPLRLSDDQNEKTRYANASTGFRAATSVGGTVTGDRGNLIVCDDLLSVEGADSAAHREEARRFFWETLPTRLNDIQADGMMVIAQRLHESDVPGEILKREPERWEKLVLPMEFEPARRCVTALGFQDPRKADGELLHPARFPAEAVKLLAGRLGHAAAGQLQQRPAPREGGLVKAAWLAKRFRDQGASPIEVVLSFDCASKAATRNDPTAMGVWARYANRIQLWHVVCRRMEFPELLQAAKDWAAEYRPNVVLIEDKDSGQQLIQQLKAETTLPVVGCDPGGLDKYTRMAVETGMLQAGRVELPESAPWVAAYLEELTTFPAATHDDQTDMTSQALRYFRAGETGAGVASAPSVPSRESWART